MASRGLKFIGERGTHQIGQLNTKWTKHLANGAKATEDFDNYLLVELSYNTDQELVCKVLTDNTKKGYLATTIEEESLLQTDGFSEEYVDFYNAEGEMVRVTDVDAQKNSRFETSAFSLNAGVTEAKKGFVAHFDVTTKKYIISNPASAHADYAGAVNKFEVVDVDTDFGYAFDVATIRLMSI